MTVTLMVLAGAGTVALFFAAVGYSLCVAAAQADQAQAEEQRRREAHARRGM
jgi:hypothetical protein